MRRHSRQALTLEAALSDQGLRVSARRLERWSTAGLGPLAGTSSDQQVRHYVAVAGLSGSGHDDDVVALRLGALGLPCDRLRGALLGRMSISDGSPQVIPWQVDLLNEESSECEFDPVFVQIETIAQQMGSAEPHSPFLRKILSAMRQNASRHSRALDEAPEDILHSYLVSLVWHMSGGEAYNIGAWAAIANIDPDTVGPDVEAFLDAVRPDPAACDDAYRKMPLEHIAAVARGLTGVASDFLGLLGLSSLSQPEIEEACCLFAPLAAYQLALLAPRVAEFGLDPGQLPRVFREILEGGAGEGAELIGVARLRVPTLPSAPTT